MVTRHLYSKGMFKYYINGFRMDNIIPSGNYVIPRVVGNIKGRIVRVIFTELGEGLNEK